MNFQRKLPPRPAVPIPEPIPDLPQDRDQMENNEYMPVLGIGMNEPNHIFGASIYQEALPKEMKGWKPKTLPPCDSK